MWPWLRASAVALVVAAAAIVVQSHAHADELRVKTRNGDRTAIVLPAGRGPAPTVIVLHGAFSSAAWTARHYGFAEAAAARGFAAVFPQGLRGCWNDGRNPFPWRANDVAFLKVLAGELMAEGVADPSRIYLAGVSNGGMMAMRMLCEASDLFAGSGDDHRQYADGRWREMPAATAYADRDVQRFRGHLGALPGWRCRLFELGRIRLGHAADG